MIVVCIHPQLHIDSLHGSNKVFTSFAVVHVSALVSTVTVYTASLALGAKEKLIHAVRKVALFVGARLTLAHFGAQQARVLQKIGGADALQPLLVGTVARMIEQTRRLSNHTFCIGDSRTTALVAKEALDKAQVFPAMCTTTTTFAGTRFGTHCCIVQVLGLLERVPQHVEGVDHGNRFLHGLFHILIC